MQEKKLKKSGIWRGMVLGQGFIDMEACRKKFSEM